MWEELLSGLSDAIAFFFSLKRKRKENQGKERGKGEEKKETGKKEEKRKEKGTLEENSKKAGCFKEFYKCWCFQDGSMVKETDQGALLRRSGRIATEQYLPDTAEQPHT